VQPENPTAGGVILADVVRFVRRFVVLSAHQADALALWIAHTHAFEAADATPYVTVTSAEKRSGKTRLLEVAELLVRAPLPTANISDAALFRAIEATTPTLLLDEVDAIFGNKAREREELRGLLNAGYRRGALAQRMGGSRMTDLQTFRVFCPKAFAGIGDCLPDTIIDRAIALRLERKTREEPVERFRRRAVVPEAEELRERLADWLEPQLDELRAAWPTLPEELDDRAHDVWESLLAIADLAAGAWPERARRAALELSGGNGAREDESLTARLLRDVHTAFKELGEDRLQTSALLEHLHAIEESPWGEWYGKPLSSHGLSKLLRPHRIKTMSVRLSDGENVRGYKREQFADAWHRVLGVPSVTGVTTVTTEPASQAECDARDACDASPTGDLLDRLFPSPNGRPPRPYPGDADFLEYVAAVHDAGQITTGEALEREGAHALILPARTRPAGETGIPF
jgi:hypothetical protein